MIETSDAYKVAIKADTELITFEGQFGFVPPGSVEGSEIETSTLSEVGRIEQLQNEKRGMDARWGTCELNRFILDGNTTAITKNGLEQTGCFYAGMSDNAGVFDDPPTLNYVMDADYDMIGVTVVFDDQAGEYASEIALRYYNQAGIRLNEIMHKNEETTATIDLLQAGVRSFEITLTEWSMQMRMAKISQVIPGQIFIFSAKNTFEFQLKEEIRPFETSLTIPEFTITFDNSDRRFDIVNPTGLVAFLRQKMQISTSLMIRTVVGEETVSTGNYYVHNWPVSGEDEESSLTCRPALAFESRYYENTGRGIQTVAEAAAIIFANVKERHIIDEALQSIEVNQYIGDDVAKVDAAGQLAVASCGYWQFCRDGSYRLRKWAVLEPTNEINYENAWEKPSIAQQNRYTSINVKYYVWDAGNEGLKANGCIVTTNPDDGEQKTISSNFIPSEERAQAVATAAMAYYGMRLKCTSNWRGDMSVEPGDTVTVENDYGYSDVLITSGRLEWNENGLNGELTGKAV